MCILQDSTSSSDIVWKFTTIRKFYTRYIYIYILYKWRLYASFDFDAVWIFRTTVVVVVVVIARATGVKRCGHRWRHHGRRFGTGHGHPEQRFVLLRVTVGRRDHYQNVRSRGVSGLRAAVVPWWRRNGTGSVGCRHHPGGGGGGGGGTVVLQVSGRSVHRLPELGGADHRVQRHGRVPETGLQVPGHPIPALSRVPAQRLSERPPVLHGHQVVQDRVDRGREVIEATGNGVQQLVHLRVIRRILGIQVEKPLRVERGPAQEERDDYGRWKINSRCDKTKGFYIFISYSWTLMATCIDTTRGVLGGLKHTKTKNNRL